MSEDLPDDPYARKPLGKLSSTPSWVMFGFVLGALFVWLLPSREGGKPLTQPQAAPSAVQPSPSSDVASAPQVAKPQAKPAPARRARLSDVEAIFAAYGEYAVWDGNRTEIAVWNAEKKSYADFYEVLRVDDVLYFRSIPQLTRPLLTHGTRSDLPLLYTESQEMRERWLETRRQLVPARPRPPEVTSPKIDVDREEERKK